jgi:CRP/FNR family transcriptional regulator
MNPDALAAFWQAFPDLDPHDAVLRAELANRPAVVWPAGKVLVRDGEECSAAPLVVSGNLQVTKAMDGFRQIQLYSIGPGECCPLTSSCLLGGDAFPATVSVESDTVAVPVPPELFLSLVGRSPSFRKLVFGQFLKRLGSVIGLVEALAFRRLDERLAEFLVSESSQDRVVLTHQEIADRLGSSREVVSRLLKEFEAKGWLTLGRGFVELKGLPR